MPCSEQVCSVCSGAAYTARILSWFGGGVQGKESSLQYQGYTVKVAVSMRTQERDSSHRTPAHCTHCTPAHCTHCTPAHCTHCTPAHCTHCTPAHVHCTNYYGALVECSCWYTHNYNNLHTIYLLPVFVSVKCH